MIKKCSYCQSEISRLPSQVNKNKTGLFFCNNRCKSVYFRLEYRVKCDACGDMFDKLPAEQKRHSTNCCSTKCRAKLNENSSTIKCEVCEGLIVRPLSQIKDHNFCSVVCHNLFQDLREDRSCDLCGVSFQKQRSIIARSRFDFCSQSCCAKFKFRESFVETEFEKMVKNLGVLYVRNDRSVVGPLELDFYFPDIKFAVEINGSAHYKPVYGDESLAKTKIRDKRKRRLCKELGIILRTVKPGNCKREVYLPRYKRAIWEIKCILEANVIRAQKGGKFIQRNLFRF